MFEDSRTQVMVCNVTNANAASHAVLKALTGSAAAFYDEPQTFTETALATNPTLYHHLAYRNGAGQLEITNNFRSGDIQNGGYYGYLARVEQVSYLGFNGVALHTGAMDAANSTYYGLKIVLNHTFGMLNNSPTILTIPYKTSAAATQSELAAGLANAATQIFERQPHKPIKCERVNAGAQLVDLDNLALVHGSKTFTSGDDDTASILVGSILRIEEPESGGEDVDDPCYIVVSHDSGAADARIYTLDQPFQGVTNADHDHCGTVTEGNWGLKFTGISVADADFNPITDEPFVVDFTIQNPGFDTADVYNKTTSLIGNGTYQLVSAMEARSQFENKTREISAYPPTVRQITAAAGSTYNIFAFEILNTAYSSPTTGVQPVSKIRVVIPVLVGLTEAFHTVLGFGA